MEKTISPWALHKEHRKSLNHCDLSLARHLFTLKVLHLMKYTEAFSIPRSEFKLEEPSQSQMWSDCHRDEASYLSQRGQADNRLTVIVGFALATVQALWKTIAA